MSDFLYVAMIAISSLTAYFIYSRLSGSLRARSRHRLGCDSEVASEELLSEGERKQRRHEQEMAAIRRRMELLRNRPSQAAAAAKAEVEGKLEAGLLSTGNAQRSGQKLRSLQPSDSHATVVLHKSAPAAAPQNETENQQSEEARKEGEQRLAAAEKTGVLASLPAVPLSSIIQVAPKLRVIRLENLQIEELPCLDQEMPRLTQIWLSRNLLQRLPEPLLLPRLERFDVSHNLLASLPEQGWASMVKLRELNVSHNRLVELPAQLSLLPALRVLSSQHNRLARIPPELGSLKEVTDLDVSDNELEEVPKELGGMRSLRRFAADNNRLSALPKELTVATLTSKHLCRLEETEVETVSVHGNRLHLKEQEGLDAYLERRTRKVVEDGTVMRFKTMEIIHEKERQRRKL